MVDEFGGAGDSFIAEFPSVVSAACCAVEIQRELGNRNRSFPENRRMHFRIGVNLGEVIVVANDLRDAGFDVSLPGSLPDGFLVVRAQIPMRAHHLHRLTTRLTRLVRRYAAAAVVVACVFSQPMVTRGLAA